MPLYEYVCQACHEQLELLVRAGQEPTCPECGSGQLTKLLSVVAAPGRHPSTTRPANGGAGPCGPCCCDCPYGG